MKGASEGVATNGHIKFPKSLTCAPDQQCAGETPRSSMKGNSCMVQRHQQKSQLLVTVLLARVQSWRAIKEDSENTSGYLLPQNGHTFGIRTSALGQRDLPEH